MIIEIEIKEIFFPILESIASNEGLPTEKYAGNIVDSWLEGQYRGSVMDKIKMSKVEDLAILKEEKLSDLSSKLIIK